MAPGIFTTRLCRNWIAGVSPGGSCLYSERVRYGIEVDTYPEDLSLRVWFRGNRMVLFCIFVGSAVCRMMKARLVGGVSRVRCLPLMHIKFYAHARTIEWYTCQFLRGSRLIIFQPCWSSSSHTSSLDVFRSLYPLFWPTCLFLLFH